MWCRTMNFFLVLSALSAAPGSGRGKQVENVQAVDETYRAFGVAMRAGISGVLEIHVTRWTTPEERQALVNSLVSNGQEKTVDLLEKQEATGSVRTQTGAGMGGWPSVSLRYAYQFPRPAGKRFIVLVADRNISTAEARGTNETWYGARRRPRPESRA
jgi:hypothetical protein